MTAQARRPSAHEIEAREPQQAISQFWLPRWNGNYAWCSQALKTYRIVGSSSRLPKKQNQGLAGESHTPHTPHPKARRQRYTVPYQQQCAFLLYLVTLFYRCPCNICARYLQTNTLIHPPFLFPPDVFHSLNRKPRRFHLNGQRQAFLQILLRFV